jgi:hypothetical protein
VLVSKLCGFESRQPSKIRNGRHKKRSGLHTLVLRKYTQKGICGLVGSAPICHGKFSGFCDSTSLKIINGSHKQRNGQHCTLARHNNSVKKKNVCVRHLLSSAVEMDTGVPSIIISRWLYRVWLSTSKSLYCTQVHAMSLN